MGPILAGTASFGSAWLGVALVVVLAFHAASSRASWDDLHFAAYLAAVYAVGATAGFAMVTACFGRWRRLAPRRAASISAMAGAIGGLMQFVGLTVWFALPLLAILRGWQKLSMAAVYFAPGWGLALLVLLALRLRRPLP